MGGIRTLHDFDEELAQISLFDDLTVTFNTATATLFSRDSGGGRSYVARANPRGSIRAVCTLGDIFYVAGSFSEINGVPAANIAYSQRYCSCATRVGYYTQKTTRFRHVGSGGGPNGQINAVFCDERESKVWAGGSFTSPGHGVAVFDLETGVWSAPPFQGIFGARAEVTSIITDSSNENLFFVGSFLTTFEDGTAEFNDTSMLDVPASAAAANGNADTAQTSPSTNPVQGFGFLAWPRSSTASNVAIDSTKLFPNKSLTTSNSLGVDLLSTLGGTAGLTHPDIGINDVVHHTSGIIFVGGMFPLTAGPASGSFNIVAFKDGVLTALAGDGLNGEVTSFLLDGDHLYVGGAFDDTISGTTSGKLSGIAMYDVITDTWTPLGSGVEGTVASLTLIDDVLHIGGGDRGVGVDDSGYTAWNIKENRWVKSGWPTEVDIGFIVGKMCFLDDSISAQFVGGFRYRPAWREVDEEVVSQQWSGFWAFLWF